MSKPVIVAVDPHREDPDAVALGVLLARVMAAPLVLASAHAVDPPVDELYAEYANAAGDQTEQALARLRSEVPLHGRTDRRAWDAVLDGHGCIDAFEIETRLANVQATERRVMLKSRDDAVVAHTFLVIGDTRANREALATAREALRGNFPLDTRAVLTAFGSGRCPGTNGLIVV